jgi:hypothetical protein
VQVHTLNLSLCGVHTHNNMHAVCTHIIMAYVVCAVLKERKETLLVCVQCGYMLSCDNLVNGAHRVLVRGGGILKFGMIHHVE